MRCFNHWNKSSGSESAWNKTIRRPLWLDQSAAVCDRDRFRAAENIQLREDVAQVPFHRGLVAGRSFCALRRRRPPREAGRRQRSCWLPIDKLTCSPAQSSETAIRRGVELATFSSKRVWPAFSRPHAFDRIETSGLAGVPSTRATRGRGWHRLCKGPSPASEGQITMNK